MNNKYEPVIGLEVHVELNTKSKMFCRCSADYFGKEPNTHTCPVCLGLPGALPYMNKKAIESCMKIGLALGCTVSELSRFERKNYFYPDLPKGYQISQYRWPLCVDGGLMIDGGRWIRINRVHQEEDTGKLTHQDGKTLIDFNRSGVPLVEIVTEPDFHSSEEVRKFAKKLQQIFRYLGVSNADMERGDMRLEANVSMRKINTASLRGTSATKQSNTGDRHAYARDDKALPNYRIELKNINSFRFMVAAIEYEIKRQSELIEKGRTLTQETRGWDEGKKETFLQRSKEEAHDYRYFPEPDLPELRIKSDEIGEIRNQMPELPNQKMQRFMKDYGISENNAKLLTESRETADHFEQVVEKGKRKQIEPKQIANYIINSKVAIGTNPDEILELIQNRRIGVIGDIGELEKLAKEVMEENPQLVEQYKKGKVTVIQALIGAGMRKSGGKADPSKISEILMNLLQT